MLGKEHIDYENDIWECYKVGNTDLGSNLYWRRKSDHKDKFIVGYKGSIWEERDLPLVLNAIIRDINEAKNDPEIQAFIKAMTVKKIKEQVKDDDLPF